MIIKEIPEFSIELHHEIKSLLTQLTKTKINFTKADFISILNSNSSFLFGAFENYKLVGILTLITYQIPTGKCGRIEVVVVDSMYRGTGIGESLSLKAIEKAKGLNVDKIFLTLNPKRIEANQLYQKIGFQLDQTNSYFYVIKK